MSESAKSRILLVSLLISASSIEFLKWLILQIVFWKYFCCLIEWKVQLILLFFPIVKIRFFEVFYFLSSNSNFDGGGFIFEIMIASGLNQIQLNPYRGVSLRAVLYLRRNMGPKHRTFFTKLTDEQRRNLGYEFSRIFVNQWVTSLKASTPCVQSKCPRLLLCLESHPC